MADSWHTPFCLAHMPHLALQGTFPVSTEHRTGSRRQRQPFAQLYVRALHSGACLCPAGGPTVHVHSLELLLVLHTCRDHL